MSDRTASDREEFGRRGDEIYERDIFPRLHSEDQGKIVAIDVETGDYEIAGEELIAADRLLTRRPEARIWLRRIGSRYLYRFGRRHVAAVSDQVNLVGAGHTFRAEVRRAGEARGAVPPVGSVRRLLGLLNRPGLRATTVQEMTESMAELIAEDNDRIRRGE